MGPLDYLSAASHRIYILNSPNLFSFLVSSSDKNETASPGSHDGSKLPSVKDLREKRLQYFGGYVCVYYGLAMLMTVGSLKIGSHYSGSSPERDVHIEIGLSQSVVLHVVLLHQPQKKGV